MTHGSLFSGIGGFDLAADWMGWENLFHCEINPFGQKVLKHYWPNAISYDDIKQTDFTIWRHRIDILSGGFPCQPYSTAGKRKGTDDERHLWPEMLRAIGEIAPRYIVGENVRGLVNWSNGVVFEQVCVDLENQAYQVQPFLLPACGVNAPHRRDRIFFIAFNPDNPRGSDGHGQVRGKNEKIPERNDRAQFGDPNSRNVADTNGKLSQGGVGADRSEKTRRHIGTLFCHSTWSNFPTEPAICGGNDGVSPKLDGITFPKWRRESIEGYGNAIVPPLVYQIFKTIEEYELNN